MSIKPISKNQKQKRPSLSIIQKTLDGKLNALEKILLFLLKKSNKLQLSKKAMINPNFYMIRPNKSNRKFTEFVIRLLSLRKNFKKKFNNITINKKR